MCHELLSFSACPTSPGSPVPDCDSPSHHLSNQCLTPSCCAPSHPQHCFLSSPTTEKPGHALYTAKVTTHPRNQPHKDRLTAGGQIHLVLTAEWGFQVMKSASWPPDLFQLMEELLQRGLSTPLFLLPHPVTAFLLGFLLLLFSQAGSTGQHIKWPSPNT